jgi:hypothetical protein
MGRARGGRRRLDAEGGAAGVGHWAEAAEAAEAGGEEEEVDPAAP